LHSPAAVKELQRGVGNRSVARLLSGISSAPTVVQRELKKGELATYKKAFQGKAKLDPGPLVTLIKTRLVKDGKTASVEHVGQVLGQIGVDVPSNLASLLSGGGMPLGEFRTALQVDNADGPIDGYDVAIPKKTDDMDKEIPVLISDLDATNMFSQHDGLTVRYDPQNAGKTTQNFQIQLGGSVVRLPKGKSSISCVVVDDAIVRHCTRDPAIAAYVLGRMKTAHRSSYASGQKVRLSMS